MFVSETAFEAVGSTTTKTNSNNGDSNAASLIQFIDTASGDANLSCIVINAVVSEQDEAAVTRSEGPNRCILKNARMSCG